MRRYIIWLIVFATIEIALSLYLTLWREHFWNSVATKESGTFCHQLLVFLVVALVAGFVSGFSNYLVQLSTIEWRKLLTTRALLLKESTIENISQRIQEDTSKYPELVLTLAFGTTKALFYIIVFATSVALSFEWWYVPILLCYTLLGSFVASYIASPLIKLNYSQQKAEATYRSDLTISNFQDCVLLMFGIAKQTKYLTYFQSFYMQIAVVIPLIIIAPVFFTTGMTMGMLMRFNSLGNTILDSSGYGIQSWGQINMLLSCRKRLKEMGVL